MKKIILLSAFIASVSFASGEQPTVFVCSTPSESSPYDTFTITFLNDSEASVSYERHHSVASEEMAVNLPVPGCAPAKTARLTKKEVYVECDGDGDAGFFDLKIKKSGIKGTVTFPEGNIEYREDTTLALGCRKQN